MKIRIDLSSGTYWRTWDITHFRIKLKGTNMKYASAYFVDKKDAVEIIVFIDEAASELPEEAILIIETTDPAELTKTVEPYWLMVTG